MRNQHCGNCRATLLSESEKETKLCIPCQQRRKQEKDAAKRAKTLNPTRTCLDAVEEGLTPEQY